MSDTTHGEAGEAQTGAQGDGRDWRGEIVAAIVGAHEAHYAKGGLPPMRYESIADHLVAALGLHDLEQAAAERDSLRDLDGTKERAYAEILGRNVELVAERDAARRELEQLRGEVGKIAARSADKARRLDGTADPMDRMLVAVFDSFDRDLRDVLAATAPATQDGAERG